MVRSLLAVLAGVFSGGVVVGVVEAVGAMINPPPGNLDLSNTAAMTEYIASLPLSAFLMVLLGYGLGSIVGGAVAARIATHHRVMHGLVVGVALLGAGVANFFTIPHPLWFQVAVVLVFLPCAYLGAKLAGGPEAGLQPASS